MKRPFAAATLAALTPCTATHAVAQADTPYAFTQAEDSESVIVAELNALDIANIYEVLCPGHSRHHLYANDEQAAVILKYMNRKAMAQSVINLDNAIAYDAQHGFPEPKYPFYNTGMIGNDNKIRPADSRAHLRSLRQEFVAQEPLPTGDTQDEAMIRALRDHAVKFCFAHF